VRPSIDFKIIRFARLWFEFKSLALQGFVAHITRAVIDFTGSANKSIKCLLYSKEWLTMLVLNHITKHFA
jgi:hypothetical protein